MGTFTTTSDVDLALFGDELTLTDQARLAAAIDKLPMAQQVDMLLYKSIDNDKLKQHIKKHGKEWFCRGLVMIADFFDTTIGEQLTLQRGFDITKKQQRPGNVPVVSSGGISSFHDEAMVKGPGVVLGRKGSIGTVFYINEDFWPHDTSLWIKDFKGNNARFVYYFFSSIANALKKMDVGAANPALNRNHVHPLPIKWTSRENQDNIVKMLSSLDDKIELNRQINQTLEEMAQAIFKSWFVDFEPVKAKIEAKANGQNPERAAMCAIRGKTDAELDQLPPDQFAQLRATAALFPDELTDSELGLIPAGWEALPLSQMVQLTGGGTPKRSNSEYWDGEIPWFSVQDAPAEGDVFVVDTHEKITQLGLDKSSTKLLPIGTTIISARGTVGRLALTGVEMAMNQSCYGVLGMNGIGRYFNFFNLQRAVGLLQQNTHGAVFDTITQQTFETVKCIKPTNLILSGFEMIISPLMATTHNNLHQRTTLTHLRNTLLPKLLSGEISIGSAQSTIDEAV
jgi:type I restriction enzyme S subunit